MSIKNSIASWKSVYTMYDKLVGISKILSRPKQMTVFPSQFALFYSSLSTVSVQITNHPPDTAWHSIIASGAQDGVGDIVTKFV